MTAVQDIDPFAPGLSTNERAMLMDLIKARDAYCLQGRGREYHAMGKALVVVWHHLRQEAGSPELPRTDFGALDVAPPVVETHTAGRPAAALSPSFSATRLRGRNPLPG
jgi:hypothetical protein